MQEISKALGIDDDYEIFGEEVLPSKYAVTNLAASTIGAVGASISILVEKMGLAASRPSVRVDQKLASLWFARSIHPVGWELPPVWDAIAGDYEGSDGWIKLHTNLPHHRQAALNILACKADRSDVAATIGRWDVNDLETAIVEAGGVAAAMRSRDEWKSHPQGKNVAAEPLVNLGKRQKRTAKTWDAILERPLAGLRILDMTRVLAGPVATRTLAGFGSDVLRIDPPDWSEPNVIPDISLGKKCCRLDLREDHDRIVFEQLLSDADLLVHGYRPDALEQLGYGERVRSAIAPELIEISLDAYGWRGPWSKRRGFDSLVQMSCGIADAGMHWAKRSVPTPLPVQALDHATGYLMAAAAICLLIDSISTNGCKSARLSLARTAELLMQYPQEVSGSLGQEPCPSDLNTEIEQTPWGPAHRLIAPVEIEGIAMKWERPGCELGSSPAQW
jgi:CoA transferase family III